MAKDCMTCKQFVIPFEKKASEHHLSDFGGTVFSFPIHRPSSKGHTNITTKRHTEDLRTMTMQEWNDILPVLKDTIKKIDRTYKPLGYRLSIPNGKAANQNQPFHFYMRVVPKYKKDYGNVSIILSTKSKNAGFEKNKEAFEKIFPINSEKVILEKGELIARLYDGREINTFTNEELVGIIAISTKKHLSNDIQAIDQETWQEIGQTLKETMAKIEANTDCHDFSIELILGEEAAKIWREEAEFSSAVQPDSELIILLYPRYEQKECWRVENRPVEKSGTKIKGSMENERIALKLRDPEAYAKIWGKKTTFSVRGHEEATNPQTKTLSPETKKEENIWKQPSTYLIFASGVGICLLGLGIYWLFSKKNKAK